MPACGTLTDGACAPTSPPAVILQRLSRLFLVRDERGAVDQCAQRTAISTHTSTVNKMGYTAMAGQGRWPIRPLRAQTFQAKRLYAPPAICSAVRRHPPPINLRSA